MKSDIEIAQEATLRPIAEIAAGLGLDDADVIPYGRYKAKSPTAAIRPRSTIVWPSRAAGRAS